MTEIQLFNKDIERRQIMFEECFDLITIVYKWVGEIPIYKDFTNYYESKKKWLYVTDDELKHIKKINNRLRKFRYDEVLYEWITKVYNKGVADE